jgi:hypothetical protein
MGLPPITTAVKYFTQRCQVPSGWTDPSQTSTFECANHRAFWHPALAGGAAAISPPAISTPASNSMMRRFVDLS